jgi:hypothetical protein
MVRMAWVVVHLLHLRLVEEVAAAEEVDLSIPIL